MIELPKVKAQFPEKLAGLFEPHPYKTLYGGRDGVKSWSIARALLIIGANPGILWPGRTEGPRILCGRETMDSIRESVHQLLTDQIVNLGLERFYTPLQSEIRGKNGAEFVFAGLRKQSVSSIKSYEAIDIFWGEEASTVTRRSLTILLPTIRKPGSEIWWSLNPDLETDAVYQDFVLNPPANSFLCRTSYRDNNWLSPESRQKIDTLRERDPDTFHHVYEGGTRSTVEGAIYKAEIQKAELEGRIREVKYDPMMPVDTFWDLGFADRVSIWAAQRTPFEIRVLKYFEGDHQAIDYYLREMQTWGYVFGTCFLPWDGGTRSLGTGKSIEELMRLKGFKVRVNRQLSVADGINATRTIFPQLYFDAKACADGLQYLRRYQWGPATALGVPRSQPLHDDASHACLTADSMVKTDTGDVAISEISVGNRVWTPCGFSRVVHSGQVKRASEFIELSLSNGRSLRCTPEHKLFTSRGLVQADALRTSDILLSGDEWNSVLSSWISTAFGLGYRDAITGKIAGRNQAHRTFTEQCGRTRTGLFLTSMISTIKMVTRSIIPLGTWRLSTNPIIPECTPSLVFSGENCFHLRPSLVNGPPSGTHPQKASSGTGSTARRHGLIVNGVRSLARIVASRSIRLFQHAPNGAPSLVSMRRVIDSRAEPEWVYDLTVENHACYQANGLLVSNSDALRTLAVGIRDPERPAKPKPQSRQGISGGWMG